MRPSDEYLIPCWECGKADCGRVVDKRDGSVLPLIDTGFRIGEKWVRREDQ